MIPCSVTGQRVQSVEKKGTVHKEYGNLIKCKFKI
jgi:hypothetical protein